MNVKVLYNWFELLILLIYNDSKYYFLANVMMCHKYMSTAKQQIEVWFQVKKIIFMIIFNFKMLWRKMVSHGHK